MATRKVLERVFGDAVECDPANITPEDIEWALHEMRKAFPATEDLGKHLNWIRDQVFELMEPGELRNHPEAHERGAQLLRAEQLTTKQKAAFVRDVQALRTLLVIGE